VRAAVASDLSWVTAVQAGGTPRSEAQVGVGCSITVGAAAIKVTSLGRMVVPGNNNVHNISIVNAHGKVVASTSFDLGGPRAATPDALGFAYGTVAQPQPVMAPGTVYYILSNENGCDAWRDDDGNVLTTTTVASDSASVYGVPPNTQKGAGGSGHCYGPLNFLYTV
jgi:hypothetical protein